jgi:hypothetical protein
MSAKRAYHRRSDDERIAQLQAKIESLQQRVVERRRPDQEVLKHAPKLVQRLRDFAKLAAQHQRVDVSNSTLAFMAGLDRMLQTPPEGERRARRGGGDHEGDGLAPA